MLRGMWADSRLVVAAVAIAPDGTKIFQSPVGRGRCRPQIARRGPIETEQWLNRARALVLPIFRLGGVLGGNLGGLMQVLLTASTWLQSPERTFAAAARGRGAEFEKQAETTACLQKNNPMQSVP